MRIEMWTGKARSYCMSAGIVIAALFFFYWYVFADSLENALWRSAIALVIAYPFVLTRAVPAAFAKGVARAARAGIRFRNTETLARAARASVVVFGKTGVLTIGTPDITDFIVFDDALSLSEALYLAASLENKSTHPLARAIVEKGALLTRPLATPFEYKEVAGMGVSGVVNGKHIEIGNLSFLEGLAASVHGKKDAGFGRFQGEGKTVVCMFVDKKLAALIAGKDTLRPFAKETVAALTKRGKEVALLTGDNKMTAETFARSLGISAVYSKLLPHDTMRIVAMVGSGETRAGTPDRTVVRAGLSILFSVGFAENEKGEWDIVCAGDDIRCVMSVFAISKRTTLIVTVCIISQFVWYVIALSFLLLF